MKKKYDNLQDWLIEQNIPFQAIDDEVTDIPGFGKLFLADLSGVKSIFRVKGDQVEFNLMENPQTLLDEGINYVAFPFGANWYYYDLREEFCFHILKYVGQRATECHAEPFVHLGVHSPYELLNGSGELATWVRKARWMGHAALGLCDRNTMAGTLNFQKACDAAGIRPVFGYTLTMEYETDQVDLKVYSLSQQGLAGLLRIQKEVMVDGDNRTLPYDLLLKHGEGNALVLGSLAAEWMLRHPHLVAQLRERFEMLFYQVDLNEYKADRIDRLRLLAAQTYFRNFYNPTTGTFSVEPILITDSYYVDRDDARNKILLNKIASGAAHDQSEEQYYKDADEHYQTLRPLFGEAWDFDALFGLMCRNTLRIAEAATARISVGQMYMPQYIMRAEEEAQYADRRTMFRRLLDEGLAAKVVATEHERYRSRLEEEVYIIESTDNVDYFLIQWDMVRKAHRRGIVTGIGRGSAGGSLVSYLLGITTVDPLRYGLLFSRFLVPERCGLEWHDATTKVMVQVPIHAGEDYVEVEADGTRYRYHPNAQLRIRCQGKEQTIYADELSCGDEIIFDRRDYLWTINEAKLKDNCLCPTLRKDG